MSGWTAAAEHMVERLRARAAIIHPAVARAFRAVPRHVFLPAADAHRAYTHGAIATKLRDSTPISSSSDPAVMAIMIEQLDLNSGANVLEIGTGTGYNAAILAELVGPSGRVVSVDIDDDICSSARANLARAGYARVQVQCRDGALGVPEQAPFDRIIVTVGIYEIASHWFDQLKPDGIIVAPLWVRGAQCLVAFRKRDRLLHSRSVRWGAFMRMRGALAGPEAYITLSNGWTVSAENPSKVDTRAIEHLRGQVPEQRDDLAERIGPSVSAFSLFLASQDPRVLVLTSSDEAGGLGSYAVGLLDSDSASLCVVMSTSDDADQRRQHVLSYGNGEMLEAMEGYLERWASIGRPGIEGLRVTATPVTESEHIPEDASTPGMLVRGSFAMRLSWTAE